MKRNHIVLKEAELEEYILNNFREDAFLEISYNRVFIPGKILFVDEDATITLQLKGQLLNQRVDININEVKKELVEIIYTYGDESLTISVID